MNASDRATFIGTTLRRESRPTILGTIVGAFQLSFVANGLLLSRGELLLATG
jgi:hypothetical protein